MTQCPDDLVIDADPVVDFRSVSWSLTIRSLNVCPETIALKDKLASPEPEYPPISCKDSNVFLVVSLISTMVVSVVSVL